MGNKTAALGAFKIASSYIGTVIGAGFASGQEVLQFFSAHGWLGLFGLLISSALFFLVGYSVLYFGNRIQAKTHVDVVRFTNGDLMGRIIDAIITIFLFGALAAMFAGAGAIFEEQFSIPAIWGALFMAVCTLFTVLLGTRGVANAMSTAVPFLIVTVLFMAVYTLIINPVQPGEIGLAKELPGATPHWLLSAVNYASYNIIIVIAVLAPMSTKAVNQKALVMGALLGALGLGLGIAAIYFCLLTYIGDIFFMQVPMIGIAEKVSPVLKFVFALVLLAAVYTTAVGNLYGFSHRLSPGSPKKRLIITVSLAALLAAQMGFSNMIRFLYPAVGYGGLLFLVGLAYTWSKKRGLLRSSHFNHINSE